MKNVTRLALALALSAAPMTMAAAQPSDASTPSSSERSCEGHRGRGRHHGDPAAHATRRAQRMSEALGLDAAQSTALQTILTVAMADFGSIHELPREERRAAMEAHRAEVDAQIEGLLNEEQRAAFAELKANHREHEARRGHARRGHRGHRGDADHARREGRGPRQAPSDVSTDSAR